ncbi:HD domain-containing protein [Bifidobacterium sp. 82T10]|uniref:HD domain-containing protein n=1 Tax=Bifidobacterium miconis TaxID=2834435 RepID=A0ABS6WGL6_9BIFI|nr:HD domain-containing protein [Bifidobacterium miconis]MBW3093168.1 HD domain-containing protein [Bifidobacterium miconis]
MSGYIPTLEQIDELHRRISPSEAAYELIHTHCVIVATIACQLARRQNALFSRRCTLPKDAPELQPVDVNAGLPDGAADIAPTDAVPKDATPTNVAASDASDATMGLSWTVPPTGGVEGGKVPPRLLDERLVMIGGLLHDIGTYRVLKHDGSDGEPLKFDGKRYILHGLLGYEWLLEQGVDESVAQFARNHTGVGLTREDVIRQDLPLPPDDYAPVNLEQETVMVADKFHSKSTPPKFLSVDAYTAKALRFGEENGRRWLALVERYGRPDIAALAEKYHMRMV